MCTQREMQDYPILCILNTHPLTSYMALKSVGEFFSVYSALRKRVCPGVCPVTHLPFFCMSARISFGLLAVLGLCLSAPNLHSHCGVGSRGGIRGTEKRSASRILLYPLYALCVVWPCYPFICPLPELALFANFAYVRIIQHSPTHPAAPPFILFLYPQQQQQQQQQCLLQQPLNPTLVLLEIRDLC